MEDKKKVRVPVEDEEIEQVAGGAKRTGTGTGTSGTDDIVLPDMEF